MEDPTDYRVLVRTDDFPNGASAGLLAYHYPVTALHIRTFVCPQAIQSGAAITPSVAATCESIVLPADDITGTQPVGYTIEGYAGAATFNYHVEDGRHGDFDITRGALIADEDCVLATHECTYDLPYEWHGIAANSIDVTPTVFPAGLRFGAATASDGTDPLAVTVGTASKLTLDATGVATTSLNVYLLQAPADVTKPTVSDPIVRFRAGGTSVPRPRSASRGPAPTSRVASTTSRCSAASTATRTRP